MESISLNKICENKFTYGQRAQAFILGNSRNQIRCLQSARIPLLYNDMEPGHEWTFFTNHAHVLVCLASNPDQSLRQVSLAIGITERAVQRIVAELEQAGYLERKRIGRRNHYAIHMEKQMRHDLEAHCSVGQILQPVLAPH